MSYSQNKEEEIILDFFKDKKDVTLLDCGANDGKTFSNSLALIERGAIATLVEPSKLAFAKLHELHKGNENVFLINAAVGTEIGTMMLHESGHHLPDKSDVALLSSLDEDETTKWKKSGVKYDSYHVDVIPFEALAFRKYDFITIDCEGLDIDILKQIDLTNVQLLCIEWNSIMANKLVILEYCSQFGMDKVIYESGENLLICRK